MAQLSNHKDRHWTGLNGNLSQEFLQEIIGSLASARQKIYDDLRPKLTVFFQMVLDTTKGEVLVENHELTKQLRVVQADEAWLMDGDRSKMQLFDRELEWGLVSARTEKGEIEIQILLDKIKKEMDVFEWVCYFHRTVYTPEESILVPPPKFRNTPKEKPITRPRMRAPVKINNVRVLRKPAKVEPEIPTETDLSASVRPEAMHITDDEDEGREPDSYTSDSHCVVTLSKEAPAFSEAGVDDTPLRPIDDKQNRSIAHGDEIKTDDQPTPPMSPISTASSCSWFSSH